MSLNLVFPYSLFSDKVSRPTADNVTTRVVWMFLAGSQRVQGRHVGKLRVTGLAISRPPGIAILQPRWNDL